MNNRQLLKLRIDEVLHYLWDPIGVSYAPSARDEYSTYAGHVWASVIEGQPKEQISRYLSEIRTKNIGLEPDKEKDDEITELVFDWHEFLKDQS